MKALINWVLSYFDRVLCDRCHQAVEGFLPNAGGMSGGVYVGWNAQMNPGENVVCDKCMWADPRYIALYGPRQNGQDR